MEKNLSDLKAEFAAKFGHIEQEIIDEDINDVIESLSQNYTVWFALISRNSAKSKIRELEALTKQIAQTSPYFVSMESNDVIGVMIIEFKTRKLTYANGRLIDTKKHDVIKAWTNKS